MDWIYAERMYKELQFEMDAASDKWNKNPTNNEAYQAYIVAKQRFSAYCIDILAELMEENKDLLEELKNA